MTSWRECKQTPWIAPQPPDLETDKATACYLTLKSGHLNLNLYHKDLSFSVPLDPSNSGAQILMK